MINFNFIAPYYDTLSKIVFGNVLLEASSSFLNKLPEQGSVLFIGCGSGEILPLLRTGEKQLMVDFVEMSERFISMAKLKLKPEQSGFVRFIHGDENKIDPDRKYSAVITFFIMDVYPQKEAEDFCRKIVSHLEPGGVWLFTDFVPSGSLYQKLLVKIMYLFFRIVSNIPAKKLPEYDLIFQQLNVRVELNQFYYNNMISAKVLRKSFQT